MTDEERSFNYNDLNLDFLELSPPKAKPVLRHGTPIMNSSSFRPSAFKAKQLAQKVAQNDVLVNKIDLLKRENSELLRKLKDFQKSATQIQILYETEKKNSSNEQIQLKAAEQKSYEIQILCDQLKNDVAEKKMQVEQLEAQLDEDKGPLTYIELAVKFLRLLQRVSEEEALKLHDKSLYSDLSKYCEDRGRKVPILKIGRKKRIFKRDQDVQCNLFEDVLLAIPTNLATQSTQTATAQFREIQTQTMNSLERHVQTHVTNSVQDKSVQTKKVELRTQSTQHISSTTTRATSTSCFIKKHNVGTCFPEPTYALPVSAMVDELLHLYNVTPLSPISDPLPLTSYNEDPPTSALTNLVPLSYKSIGTCTYLCNVQRQIDFIPIVANFKRSQSSSPSLFLCDGVKNEAYATPTPSPPPVPLPAAPAMSHKRSGATTITADSDNFSNMQPFLTAFTEFPDMQPEAFSTIWQMAGKMFMGLMYPPTNNRMRIAQSNRPQSPLNQQQFHSWISSLYGSMQQPPQQATSTTLPHNEFPQLVTGMEGTFNMETETSTNTIQSDNFSNLEVAREHHDNNATTTTQRPAALGADESTQTDNTIPSSVPVRCESESNYVDWIFKEPLEIPKKSAKLVRARKPSAAEATYRKTHWDKRTRKKRSKEKKKVAKELITTLFNGETDAKSQAKFCAYQQSEQDFATAVEFCANLYNLNQDSEKHPVSWDLDAACQTNALADQSDYCEKLASIENMTTNQTINGNVDVDNNCGKDGLLSDLKLNKNIEKIAEVDIHCENIASVENMVDKQTDNSKAGMDINCVKDGLLSEHKLNRSIDKRDVQEYVKVPDEIQCDNLVNTEVVNKIAAQPESCGHQFPQENTTSYSLFGCDSDEDSLRKTEECMILGKPEEWLKCKNTQAERGSLSEIVEAFSENASNQHITDYFLPPTTLASTETSDDSKKAEADASGVPQILLDLDLSETESEENEANKSAIRSLGRNESETFSEGYETDDPILVIAEGLTDYANMNRSTSESSGESIPKIDFTASSPQSPARDPVQLSGSDDGDISVLLESEIVDDLLANASTQKLFDSILRETPNDLCEAQGNTPRRRGRKRKSEMPTTTFCKRSERLRAKQKENAQLSNGKTSISPAKQTNIGRHNTIEPSEIIKRGNHIPFNFDESSNTNTTSNSIQQSLTKQEVDKQFQQFIELKQRGNQSEINNKGITDIHDEELPNEENTNFLCRNSIADIHMQNDASCPKIKHIEKAPPTALPLLPLAESIAQSCQEATVSASKAFHPNSSMVEKKISEHCVQINQTDYSMPFLPLTSSTSYSLSEVSKGNPPPCAESDGQLSAHFPPTMLTDYITPSSPQLASNVDNTIDSTEQCREIPLELNRAYYPYERTSLLQHLINNYSADVYKTVTGLKNCHKKENKFVLQLENFLNNTRDRVDVLASTLAASLHEEVEDDEVIANVIIDQISKAPRPEVELECELARVPRKYLGIHLRLISIVLRHLQYKRPEAVAVLMSKIENRLFNYQHIDKNSLHVALNLTQLYLLVIPLQKEQHNPARLFLAKCLYYYNVMAFPMIYEVLCWYPTTLPHRDEPNYDRSDALITVIQHLLMCNTYNMDSKDLRHRELLSLLRFEYHFVPFQPKALEVLCNLVTKLKAGHLTQLKYAFAIFCKRQTKLVDILLQQQLLPLADEYYKLLQHSTEYDERVAALLECISVVVKPLPLDTDVSFYLSIFERFLGAVQRPVVQEAAVLAILRLQRFGQNRCFYALAHFKPHYPVQMLVNNALKTFIHKKPFKHWKGLIMQTANN